ncbi:MAG TPA: metalloprotease [Bacteroidetes bacterium]|nr:metalloprotease [Bacteroidota bacterium]
MRWKGRQGSSNVDDRRGSGGGRRRNVRRGAAGIGVGTIIAVVIAIAMGGDPVQVLQNIQPSQSVQNRPSTGRKTTRNKAEDELAQFVSVVLKDCEDVWNKVFKDQVRGGRYEEPTLVLFSGSTESACGFASAATGPFYCPGDQDLYIDLEFYHDLKNKFGAPGDFAMAYVVAHEVGHHVQYLLGTTQKVHREKGRISKAAYNKLSVKLELQADFYAGLWAHHAQKMKNILEKGDIEEAMNAAQAIGDDRLQKRSRGRVAPETFTHGTSAQRMRWYKKGLTSGRLRDGDTFNAKRL